MAYNPISDNDCVAWYKFNDWRVLKDRAGVNSTDLTVVTGGSANPVFDTVAPVIGKGKFSLGVTYYTSYYITDANLDDTFPTKSGGSYNSFSIVFGYRGSTQSTVYETLVSKWRTSDNQRSWRVGTNNRNKLFFQISTNGTNEETVELDVPSFESVLRSYQIAFSYNAVDYSYRLRAYCIDTDTTYNATGNFTGAIYNSTANFNIIDYDRTPNVVTTWPKDNFSIYNTVLDATDFINLYTESTQPTDYSSCAGWWYFDDTEFYYDSSDNQNHLNTNEISQPSPRTYGHAQFYAQTTDTKYGDYVYVQEKYYVGAARLFASLSTNFPLKYGTSNTQFSFCAWVKPNELGNATFPSNIFGFGQFGTCTFGARLISGYLYLTLDPTVGVQESIQYNHATLSTGTWYHISVTYDYTTKAYRIRIWDDTAGAQLGPDVTGTTTGTIDLKSGDDFGVGTSGALTSEYSVGGRIDDVCIFRRILTADEIDEIRAQTFEVVVDYSLPNVYLGVDSSSSVFQVRVLADPPKERVSETLAWNTNILKQPYSDNEQRMALRISPRQRFKYSYVVNTLQRRREIQSIVSGFAKKKWGIPVWTEAVQHTGVLSVGASTINIDTTNADFRASSYGLVWQNESTWEIIRITSKTDSSLSLTTTLVNSYTGTKFVMPLRQGYLRPAANVTPLKNGTTEIEAEFEVIDNTTLTGYTAGQEYDSLEVVTRGSLLTNGEGTSHSIDNDVLYLDNGVGLLGIENRNTYNKTMQEHVLFYNTKASIWDLRKWLHQLYGRQKAFLVPTYTPDVDLSRAVGAGDSVIYITNIQLAFNTDGYDLLNYIGFLNTDGTVTVRKISAIAEVDASEESITLTSTVGTAFALGTTVMFVWKCRLGSDEIAIEWSAKNTATINTSVVRVTQ